MRWLCLLLLTGAFQDRSPKDIVQSAIDATAKESYAYRVGGRFTREGVFLPPDLLTARIEGFLSARNGSKILVKGPEGIWMTPDERLGEKVEGTPPDVADKVATLREAERPHEMLATLLADVKPGRVAEIPGGYSFAYETEKVRAYLRKEIDKAVERKSIAKPDSVAWETAEGRLRVYVTNGALTKFSDVRSVSIRYSDGEAEERKKYRTEMEFEITSHGKAKVDLPDEVKKRLDLQER